MNLRPISPLDQLACGYRNSSDRMVIARCFAGDTFFLERVVFPFELLSFACPPDAELEIWTHGLGGPELIETIPSRDLAIETAAGQSALEAVGGLVQDELLESWAAAG